MEQIRDCLGRIVCKGNPGSGFIEIRYRDLTVQAILAIGDSYTVEREKVVTTITRTSKLRFSVSSCQKAA